MAVVLQKLKRYGAFILTWIDRPTAFLKFVPTVDATINKLFQKRGCFDSCRLFKQPPDRRQQLIAFGKNTTMQNVFPQLWPINWDRLRPRSSDVVYPLRHSDSLF